MKTGTNKNKTMLTALAGLTAASALALTGCTSDNPTGSPSSSPTHNPSSAEDQPAAQGSDQASVFLACLSAAEVEAKINASNQVLVKVPGQPGNGGGSGSGGSSAISSDTAGGGGLLAMEGDDAGNTWVAVESADYFADTPDVQDAYTACQAAHPDFEQPQFDPQDDPAAQQEAAEQEEAALAFAQCAREQGYSQIADPDFSVMNGILIPEGFTEQEFRALIEACWDPNSNFVFGSSEDLGFEPWTVLDEFQNTPAS